MIRGVSRVVIGLAILPPVVVAVVIARYGLNVPHGDQWALVPLLQAAAERHLAITQLWEPHNEHRPALPRLAMLGLAHLTGWDVRYELFASLLLALALCAVLIRLIVRGVGAVAPGYTPWLILAASVSTFSLAQWHNWVWGWQLTIWMNVLAAGLVALAVARYGRSWTGLALGLAAATAGALSFANGLLLFVLLPLGAVLAPGPPRLRHWLGVALATAFGAAVTVGYFTRLGLSGHTVLTGDPQAYARYVLAFVGASLGLWSVTVAAAWGCAGIAMYAIGTGYLWRRRPASRSVLVPWALIAVYALASGMMTAIGRVGFGEKQALAPRYVTISSLFWMAVIITGALLVADVWERSRAPGKRVAVVVIASAVAALGGASIGRSWAHGLASLQGYHALHVRGRDCVRRYTEARDSCLRIHYADAAVLRERARWLESRRLSLFAKAPASPAR
jgi:hypothetical protein